MSDIGTHKQRVDQQQYNQHFDEVYQEKSKPRPGKTKYVYRNGHMVPWEDVYPRVFRLTKLGPVPEGMLNLSADFDYYQKKVLQILMG
jgi:hypothetical protein